jgi:hypothetical protein
VQRSEKGEVSVHEVVTTLVGSFIGQRVAVKVTCPPA